MLDTASAFLNVFASLSGGSHSITIRSQDQQGGIVYTIHMWKEIEQCSNIGQLSSWTFGALQWLLTWSSIDRLLVSALLARYGTDDLSINTFSSLADWQRLPITRSSKPFCCFVIVGLQWPLLLEVGGHTTEKLFFLVIHIITSLYTKKMIQSGNLALWTLQDIVK